MKEGSLFQFHKGTIRTSAHVEVYVDVAHFNSIKVRLEPLSASSVSISTPFQFHKGTIRTIPSAVVVSASPLFQFHKGTIRT